MARNHLASAAVLAVFLGCAALSAQQPPPPPDPTAINPAQARADQAAGTRLDGPGFAVAYSDDAGLLIAACEGGSLHYWHKDVAMGVRGADGSPHVVKAHHGPATAVVAAKGLIASAGVDGKVLLWDLPSEKIVRTLDAATVVRSLAASPDGKLLASAGDNGIVQLWDPATGKPGLKLEGAKDWLLAVAISPDAKTVAAGGYDGKLRLWESATGKLLAEVAAQPPPASNTPAAAQPPANVVWALAFSPDGKQIVAAGSDAGVYLFQATDGKFIRAMAAAPSAHTSTVTGLAFHPSNTLLVSASKDRTLRLWNPTNGQLYKALEGHTAWVQGLTFFAQGTRLASASADNSVRLWDLTEPPKK
jgi:WD40 repeat protein